jgi:hypothetical protein
MQFCKDCGGVLNLFGKDDRELCPACIQNRKTVPPFPTAHQEGDKGLLNDAVLSIENGKMVLRSKEGWELWSAAPGIRAELQDVLAKAGRIYAIRLRRQKN